MLRVIVLVCAASLDHSGCDRRTAQHVYHGPPSATVQACMMDSQVLIAQNGLSDPKTQFFKVVCERDRQQAAR